MATCTAHPGIRGRPLALCTVFAVVISGSAVPLWRATIRRTTQPPIWQPTHSSSSNQCTEENKGGTNAGGQSAPYSVSALWGSKRLIRHNLMPACTRLRPQCTSLAREQSPLPLTGPTLLTTNADFSKLCSNSTFEPFRYSNDPVSHTTRLPSCSKILQRRKSKGGPGHLVRQALCRHILSQEEAIAYRIRHQVCLAGCVIANLERIHCPQDVGLTASLTRHRH